MEYSGKLGAEARMTAGAPGPSTLGHDVAVHACAPTCTMRVLFCSSRASASPPRSAMRLLVRSRDVSVGWPCTCRHTVSTPHASSAHAFMRSPCVLHMRQLPYGILQYGTVRTPGPHARLPLTASQSASRSTLLQPSPQCARLSDTNEPSVLSASSTGSRPRGPR